MKLLGLFSGSKDVKEKSKAQLDQEALDEAEVQAAYALAKKERRIENAKRKAVLDADKLANQKPFYQKVIGAASAITKDLASGASQMNPDALFTWNDEPQSQGRRQRRKKKRRQTEQTNPYPLF
jgi:hypothetical protein